MWWGEGREEDAVHALEGGTGREQGGSERRDGGDAGVEDVVTSVVLGGERRDDRNRKQDGILYASGHETRTYGKQLPQRQGVRLLPCWGRVQAHSLGRVSAPQY
jgi:hypothetical protein